jgi:hypothetical protein
MTSSIPGSRLWRRQTFHRRRIVRLRQRNSGKAIETSYPEEGMPGQLEIDLSQIEPNDNSPRQQNIEQNNASMGSSR